MKQVSNGLIYKFFKTAYSIRVRTSLTHESFSSGHRGSHHVRREIAYVGESCSATLYHCPLLDGTNAQYEAQNTNVVKLFGLLRKDCTEQQVTYYQAGIGTYLAPGSSCLFSSLHLIFILLDEAVAWYLDAHVMEGYEFLMDNYRSGDKICLFGFSRGAYTARALAGMLTKVGLLPRDNLEQVDFAYKAYKQTDEEGVQLAAGFKQAFSRDVKVEFVGVWDTVQSTGMMVNRQLPFSDTTPTLGYSGKPFSSTKYISFNIIPAKSVPLVWARLDKNIRLELSYCPNPVQRGQDLGMIGERR